MSLWDHSYSLLDGKVTVLVHEDLDAGLGGTLFDGSVALTAFVERLVVEKGISNVVENKVFIELGAGCGFPGLFVGKLGGRVILTDVGGPAVDLLLENIEKNELTATAQAKALDWFSEKDLDEIAQIGGGRFDYILAADTIYSEDAVEPFLRVCVRLSQPSTQILFAHPRARVPKASEKFWNLVGNYFTVEKIQAERFVKDWTPESKQFLNERQGVFILRLK